MAVTTSGVRSSAGHLVRAVATQTLREARNSLTPSWHFQDSFVTRVTTLSSMRGRMRGHNPLTSSRRHPGPTPMNRSHRNAVQANLSGGMLQTRVRELAAP